MTTVRLDDLTKERLEKYRHPSHDSWSDTIAAVLAVVPSPINRLVEGCVNCGRQPRSRGPIEEMPGVVRTYTHEEPDGTLNTGTNYYCSADCLQEVHDEIAKQVPDEPDLVRVGGCQEMAARFSDATFYIDNETKQVTIGVPGAFAGEDSHDGEYDYIGEPVYIKNRGDWVQDGVIEDIIHEETSTILDLGYDSSVTRHCHPDPDKREDHDIEAPFRPKDYSSDSQSEEADGEA
jgi:hypothetical protein